MNHSEVLVTASGQAPTESPSPPGAAPASSAAHDKGPLDALREANDLSACLLPLIEALGWNRDLRHVAESLPHFVDSLDLTAFRNVMAELDFQSRDARLRLDEIDPRLMPCLFLPDGASAMVVLREGDTGLKVFDSGAGGLVDIPAWPQMGLALFFQARDKTASNSREKRASWFWGVADRFRGQIYQLLMLTLLLNVLALVTPLFVMAVYDQVIAAKSLSTLGYLSLGVFIAVASDLALRTLRTQILAFIGARLSYILPTAVFEKILFLPTTVIERATIGSQVARIKDFENVRDFFTGPIALTILELPFVILFIGVIAVLGGPLAFIPLIMIALYAVLGAVTGPILRKETGAASSVSTQRQEFVVEALSNLRTLKSCGAEREWLKRYREMSGKAAMSGFRVGILSSMVNTMSHVLMALSGICTIAFGILRVLDQQMTVGALVASMILVWRVLAPLQTAFLSVARLNQVRSSLDQIDNLMNMRQERDPNLIFTPIRSFKGKVTFSRVSLRYSADTDPALMGVSFEAAPGEVVVVIGGSGSGKTTILKVISGMYVPQGGAVRIDNQDIRQIDPLELRYAIGYVPQVPRFFYGTIAQNLRLAHPLATDEDLRWAAEQASALEDILALEEGEGKWRRTGFDVRIGDAGADQLPSSLKQRLNLARGFVKRPPILLLDEPGSGLDFDADRVLMSSVERMRGISTVFIVTHRPSHLRVADKIVWLEDGVVRAAGPAGQVRGQIPKHFL